MGYANNRTTGQTIASGGLAVYPGKGRDGRVSAGGPTRHIEAERFQKSTEVQGGFGTRPASIGAGDEPAARLHSALKQPDNVLPEARFGHTVSQRVDVAEASRRAPVGGLGDPEVVPEPRQPPSRRSD